MSEVWWEGTKTSLEVGEPGQLRLSKVGFHSLGLRPRARVETRRKGTDGRRVGTLTWDRRAYTVWWGAG